MAARSAATVRPRSAASLAMRSRSMRSRSALSSAGAGSGSGSSTGVGSGAGSSGGGPPPQAAANAAAVNSISSEGARIITPKSWVRNDCGAPKAARPRRKSSGTWGGQLPDSAGFDVHDPDLTTAAAVGDEGDMPAIGCPGWVFVPAGRCQLPHPAAAYIDQEDLGAAGNLAMEDYTRTVRRPLRSVRTSGGAKIEGRQQLLIGSVSRHHV